MTIPAIVKTVIEKMYIGTCTVIEQVESVDVTTKRSIFAESTVFTNQPCRLSYNSSPITGDGNVAKVVQEITLFISPDVTIKNGSKIVVTQHGKTQTFTNASEPKIYDSHQEVALKMFDGWSH